MVLGPIASAAAPVVVQSATDDEGLLNKLFKIAMLIGVLALGAISIIILSFVVEIADLVGATFNIFTTALDFVSVLPGPIGFLATAATAIFSAFGFGGRG